MTANEIRHVLTEYLGTLDPSAAVFAELPLCRGVGRADIAEVNGWLSGFEIKSDRDNLLRLPSQISLYECVFDYCWVVVGRRHLEAARSMVPRFWGIASFRRVDDKVEIFRIRKATRNHNANTYDQIRLLWKHEAIKVLRQIGSPVKPTEPIKMIWDELMRASPSEVAARVREQLKAREGQLAARL